MLTLPDQFNGLALSNPRVVYGVLFDAVAQTLLEVRSLIFSQVLADLTASPDLCRRVRRAPEILHQRYRLTEREWNRLVGIVRHPGMECACIVYRANRLAPLVMNIPQTCKALGKDLRVVSEYWSRYPESNVHFYIETDRFCGFLRTQLVAGRLFDAEVRHTLAQESALVSAALRESYTEADAKAKGGAC